MKYRFSPEHSPGTFNGPKIWLLMPRITQSHGISISVWYNSAWSRNMLYTSSHVCSIFTEISATWNNGSWAILVSLFYWALLRIRCDSYFGIFDWGYYQSCAMSNTFSLLLSTFDRVAVLLKNFWCDSLPLLPVPIALLSALVWGRPVIRHHQAPQYIYPSYRFKVFRFLLGIFAFINDQ